MVSTTKALTEADIMSKIVAPKKPSLLAAAAKSLLRMRFTPTQRRRINELAEKNNSGTITPTEKDEMDNFLRVGNFLSLIQSKARLSMNGSTKTSFSARLPL